MAVASTALLCVFALPVTFTAVVVALTVSGALGSYQSVLVARFTIDVPNLIRAALSGSRERDCGWAKGWGSPRPAQPPSCWALQFRRWHSRA